MRMTRLVASASASGGAGQHVVFRRQIAGGDGAPDEVLDDVAVFAVDADLAAVLGRDLHHPHHHAVVDHQGVGIGGEHLEAGHALTRHQVLQVDQGLVVDIGQHQMRAHVDRGAGGATAPFLETGGQADAARLAAEIDQCRGAPEGGGLAAGGEGVGGARRAPCRNRDGCGRRRRPGSPACPRRRGSRRPRRAGRCRSRVRGRPRSARRRRCPRWP